MAVSFGPQDYDPYIDMRRKEYEYRKMQEMMQRQQEAPRAEKPKKPSCLNPKLLLTKG